MSIITFALTPLLDIIEKTKSLANTPTYEELFDPQNWKTEPLNADGLTQAQFTKQTGNEFGFWPDASKIDTSKLKDSFSLVGDHGVYLMPNKNTDGTASENGNVVYAQHCNPEIDENFYENKVQLFGGDDGVVSIPFEWALIAKENNNTEFKISLSENSCRLISEFTGNKPKTLKPKMKFTYGDKEFELIKKGDVRGHWIARCTKSHMPYNLTGKQLRQANFLDA